MRGKKLKRRHRAVMYAGLTLVLASGCTLHSKSEKVSSDSAKTVPDNMHGIVTISFPYVEQPGEQSNQFAVWVEDENGTYIKTIFVTDYTAFGGYETREDLVPEWVDKSGVSKREREDLDAVSGATPQSGVEEYEWMCVDENGDPVPSGEYKILVEGSVKQDGRILYTTDITVGSKAMTAQGQPEYYELTGDTDMIGNVTVEYRPD